MTDLSEFQIGLLAAALQANRCITVTATPNGDVSTRVGSKRICGSVTPIEGLVGAGLVELVGKHDDPDATLTVGEIQGVHLYQLTPAGRAIAQELGTEDEAANSGGATVRLAPKSSDV